MSNGKRRQTRRTFLKVGAAAAIGAAGWRAGRAAADSPAAPVRTVTRGPKFHWFAYYDKLQFDPSQRYLLGMEVDFEHGSPTPDDVIRIGMIDLEDGDRWIELGESRAWCWQQGCMLQWRPGSQSEILWNDREGDRFVCHLLDVKTGKKRTIPHPVYTVSSDGKTAVAPDFSRIDAMRPGYGYKGLPDRFESDLAPKDSGIFRIDLESGESRQIISLAQIAAIPYPISDLSQKKHYFNHLLFGPDGKRFIFLHRWAPRDTCDCRTRMFTAAPDGSDVRVVDHSGCTSHFIWRDPEHILAWSWHVGRRGGYTVFEDKPEGGQAVDISGEVMYQDGHCTYLPGNEWIVNDSYPDANRNRSLFLYHVATGKVVPVGLFHSPKVYDGEWRCDLHPRHSPDGNYLTIDSPHTGEGRQIHLIDIRELVKD